MPVNSPLIVGIGGPTASGKTAFSVALARHFNCPIINADSRQVYKELSVGTAKPTSAERSGIPHYLMGHISINQPYTTGIWQQEVDLLFRNELKDEPVVLLVGGTALYFKSLIFGLDDLPATNQEIRDEVEAMYQKTGLSGLQSFLKQHDPEMLKHLDQQNHRRLMRPVEIYLQTGKTMTQWLAESEPRQPRKHILFYPEIERSELYQRINTRVENMVTNGLLEEVEKHQTQLGQIQGLQTVGYQEFVPFFEGLVPLEEVIGNIQQNTRRYAKKQITFFKKMPGITLPFQTPGPGLTEAIGEIEKRLTTP